MFYQYIPEIPSLCSEYCVALGKTLDENRHPRLTDNIGQLQFAEVASCTVCFGRSLCLKTILL